MKRTLLQWLLALTVLSIQARADLVQVNFSGVWDNYAGLAQSGDSFSGVISWDDGLPFRLVKTLSFSTVPGFNTITGPYLDFAHNESGLFGGPYAIPNPTVAVRCSPSTAYDGAARRYYLDIGPTQASLLCVGEVAASRAYALNYEYSLTSSSDVVTGSVSHAPEPRYTLLLAGAVAVLLVRRSRKHALRLEPIRHTPSN